LTIPPLSSQIINSSSDSSSSADLLIRVHTARPPYHLLLLLRQPALSVSQPPPFHDMSKWGNDNTKTKLFLPPLSRMNDDDDDGQAPRNAGSKYDVCRISFWEERGGQGGLQNKKVLLQYYGQCRDMLGS
jgi:hypothetical protein